MFYILIIILLAYIGLQLSKGNKLKSIHINQELTRKHDPLLAKKYPNLFPLFTQYIRNFHNEILKQEEKSKKISEATLELSAPYEFFHTNSTMYLWHLQHNFSDDQKVSEFLKKIEVDLHSFFNEIKKNYLITEDEIEYLAYSTIDLLNNMEAPDFVTASEKVLEQRKEKIKTDLAKFAK